MSPKPQVLSNAELIILEIILEMESISGYDLNKLIEERQIREWTDIGTTSVYLSLKKLQKKNFVSWIIDKNKIGKGPLPRRFSVTNEGKKNLTDEILHSLSETGERDKRFDIAFYGIGFIHRVVVAIALEKRIEHLFAELKKIEGISNSETNENLPLHKKSIFQHRTALIKKEIEFMNQLLDGLRDKTVAV